MTELARLAPAILLVASAIVFAVLFFIDAPYGRHRRGGWGPTIPARWSWIVMESPSVFLFGALWLANPDLRAPVVAILGALWLAHYVQRTFVFPFLLRGGERREPIVIAASALAFNVLNATGNAVALRGRSIDPAFVVGVIVFALGFAINLHADHVLRTLRAPGETGYKIPHGGAFRWVTSANYLGECLEWLGFAIAAGTLAAWAFAAFTFANLAPRARSHQRWYRARFADYPRDRRILIPYLW